MSNSKMQDQFQVWWMSGAYGSRKYDRFSEIGLTEDDALEIWQASREALVVYLPDTTEMAERAAAGNEYSAIRIEQQARCRASIEAAGLKVSQ